MGRFKNIVRPRTMVRFDRKTYLIGGVREEGIWTRFELIPMNKKNPPRLISFATERREGDVTETNSIE